MSKIKLPKANFDRLESLGFKHRGWFMSDGRQDCGEEHQFTSRALGVRIGCKFAWRDTVWPWSYGFESRDRGKYAWCWCDWPDLESCLETLGIVMLGAEMIGDALSDPLRIAYRPKLEPLLSAAAFCSTQRRTLGPRDYPVGFHFRGLRRRQFFKKYFTHWGAHPHGLPK